jgi:cysteinyl-tRNA synthetase
MKYLGEQFDIHTGGIDHIPIHHTNEIAQSEGATGKKWVNYWLHNEFLVIAKDKNKGSEESDGKMSKSSGNFLTLQTLIDKGYDPLDYRFFLLGAHYRSQVAFSWEAMEGAKNARKALNQRISRILNENDVDTQIVLSSQGDQILRSFTEAIEDDLASPRCLSELQVMLKNPELADNEKVSLIRTMDKVLGLRLIDSALALKQQKTEAGEVNADIEALIQQRTDAKKQKNYALADKIRSELQEKGIILEDTPQGTIWKNA